MAVDWLRMGRGTCLRIWQVPYVRRRRGPYLCSLAPTAAVPLGPGVADIPASWAAAGEPEPCRPPTTEPAVVLVEGEAGVGKTRLVAELIGGCATDGTRVLVGGCVPRATAPCPMRRSWRVLRTLVAEVGVDEVRKLVGPSWPELTHLAPGLGEQAPLVLVIEDLHWADAPPVTCWPSWAGTSAGNGSCWW
jgi:AAA ATPase domain